MIGEVTVMRFIKLLAFFSFYCISLIVNAEANREILTFGITPQQSPTEIAKLWGPICQYMSKRTGYEIQFKTSRDLSAFWNEAEEGHFDLVYINPPRYVNIHTKQGYTAFAKDSESPLIVIIVSRKDGLKSVKELEGKTIAVPNLNALATQLPQAYLKKEGIDVSVAAVNNHESVFHTVEKGIYPAGTSNLRIFGMLDPARQAEFNILWKTEPLPPFAFASHPRVSPKAIKSIQHALLDMSNNPEGKALLATLNVKGIDAAKDSDYNVMRKMNIKME